MSSEKVERTMSREYMGRWIRLVAAPAVVVALGACGGGQAAEPQESQPTARTLNVEVEYVTERPFTEYVRAVGQVLANQDVTIAAEESGVIRVLHVEKGTVVTAGQPIAKVDDAVLRAESDRASSEAQLARERYERQRRLWEDEGVGSEIAYLEAKHGAEMAEANARVLASRLDRTTIKAPIDGIFDARYIEIGTMVNAGTEIGRIVDHETVKVVAGVPERFAGEIRTGADARIALDVLGGRQFEGLIEFVGAAVHENNRTFAIEVSVPNPNGDIKPGMVSQVQVARRTFATALQVPQNAVLRAETGYVVYVAVERDGIMVAEERAIRPGASLGGRVVIEEGLSAGEAVIVVGQQRAATGDLLRVVERGEER
jgi:membrane fusion protein, multidrug efflux system